ncbi:MAG: LCP family protein [Clostridia bacterium]|nr:LCP family protein [Clostridia bacterium]
MDKHEKEYQEYLSLRLHEQEEEISRGYNSKNGVDSDEKYGQFFPEDRRTRKVNRISAMEEPYEAPDPWKDRKERQRRDREMQEYLAARQADRDERGVRSGIVHTDYDEYGNLRGRKKNSKRKYKELTKAAKKVGKTGRPKRRMPAPVMAFLIVLALAAVLAVGGGGLLFTTLASAQHVSVDRNNIGIDAGAAGQLDGYRNIAVLGTDARADDNDSQVRSDAIIVASINEETDEVKMFSVFRDTLLDVGDQGLDKITHAYFYGGAEQSLYTLNKNLDLNIDEVVVINWKTVADVIDSVGGIEIDVQESEIDEMNKYINETAKNVDGPDDKIEGPGKQTLNGVQAVTYSRIRKDAATGDYRRNERMKIVFSETFKKVKSAGPFKMLSVARHAMPEVRTNIGTLSMLKLMLHAKSYDMTDSTTGFPYDVGSWTGYGGAGYAWYGPPINLTNNVSKLHAQFFNQEGYEPSATVQEISAEISALTGLY